MAELVALMDLFLIEDCVDLAVVWVYQVVAVPEAGIRLFVAVLRAVIQLFEATDLIVELQ